MHRVNTKVHDYWATCRPWVIQCLDKQVKDNVFILLSIANNIFQVGQQLQILGLNYKFHSYIFTESTKFDQVHGAINRIEEVKECRFRPEINYNTEYLKNYNKKNLYKTKTPNKQNSPLNKSKISSQTTTTKKKYISTRVE